MGYNQLLSIVYCSVRLRKVEILAQAHTAKQRQSKAQKAYFCSLIFRILSAKWNTGVGSPEFIYSVSQIIFTECGGQLGVE